jgi:hypothetical protein
VSRTLSVKPLTATPRIGNYTSNETNKIKWAELQAHIGLIANIECCDISGTCVVQGFEVYIIPVNSKVMKSKNKGQKFTNQTIELFKKSKHKDLVMFRNILYRCPGSEYDQRMPDMVLEIE